MNGKVHKPGSGDWINLEQAASRLPDDPTQDMIDGLRKCGHKKGFHISCEYCTESYCLRWNLGSRNKGIICEAWGSIKFNLTPCKRYDYQGSIESPYWCGKRSPIGSRELPERYAKWAIVRIFDDMDVVKTDKDPRDLFWYYIHCAGDLMRMPVSSDSKYMTKFICELQDIQIRAGWAGLSWLEKERGNKPLTTHDKIKLALGIIKAFVTTHGGQLING